MDGRRILWPTTWQGHSNFHVLAHSKRITSTNDIHRCISVRSVWNVISNVLFVRGQIGFLRNKKAYRPSPTLVVPPAEEVQEIRFCIFWQTRLFKAYVTFLNLIFHVHNLVHSGKRLVSPWLLIPFRQALGIHDFHCVVFSVKIYLLVRNVFV